MKKSTLNFMCGGLWGIAILIALTSGMTESLFIIFSALLTVYLIGDD